MGHSVTVFMRLVSRGVISSAIESEEPLKSARIRNIFLSQAIYCTALALTNFFDEFCGNWCGQ